VRKEVDEDMDTVMNDEDMPNDNIDFEMDK